MEWLSIAELEARLLRYPPIGLGLRAFFHARTAQDPTEALGRPAEVIVEEGLGPMVTWAGFIDTLPFSLRAASRPFGGFGLDVWFPVRAGGDRVLLDALAKLPIPTPSSAMFDTLTPGTFGVARVGDREPVFTTSSRDDAVAAAGVLNAWATGSHAVIRVEAQPPSWLVIGPPAGPYVSRVEVTRDEATARKLATAWSTRYGVSFRVARAL